MAPAGLFAPSGQKISEKSGGAVVDCGVGGMNRHWFGDGRTRLVWAVALGCVDVRIRDLGEAARVYFIHAVAEGGNVLFAMGCQ